MDTKSTANNDRRKQPVKRLFLVDDEPLVLLRALDRVEAVE
jgi:hypothetical protein